MEGKDGLILQGCGGDAQEWVDGINEMFTEAGILKDGSKFKDVSTFQYSGTKALCPRQPKSTCRTAGSA